MKKIAGLFLAVGIIISACNMPTTTGPSDQEISTAAALTVQAVINVTPLASPTAKNQSVTAEATKAVQITATFSSPWRVLAMW